MAPTGPEGAAASFPQQAGTNGGSGRFYTTEQAHVHKAAAAQIYP